MSLDISVEAENLQCVFFFPLRMGKKCVDFNIINPKKYLRSDRQLSMFALCIIGCYGAYLFNYGI